MLRRTVGAATVCVAVLALALASAAKADDARTARLRLLCAQISGDLTEPDGLMQFRRCMNSANPVTAMRQNALPPRHPIPGLVARTGVALTSNGAARGATGCGRGQVWRGATPGDHRCVSRQVHAAILLDNANAGARIGGPNGACRQGFVWREATPADRVCVTPATRALARSQNG